MIRTFIAIPIPDPVRVELARIIDALRVKNKKNRGVRWVRPEGIHLTLKFLGNIDESMVGPISDRLDDIATSYDYLDLGLDELGVFPGMERPRVVWVGLRGGIDILEKMAAQLDRMAADFGVKKESRPFRAHLTLGRLKFPTVLDINLEIRDVGFSAHEVLFYKSELFRDGARHTVLNRTRLRSKGGKNG